MPAFMISYDLRKARDYERLIQQLRDWNCIRPLESAWFGILRGPARVIRDLLRASMDGDDGIMVVEMPEGSDWATHLVDEGAQHWLSRNVNASQYDAEMRRALLGGTGLAPRPSRLLGL